MFRADESSATGSFVREILEYLAEAHSVIADLSGRNANVFYDLGVRHALESAHHPDRGSRGGYSFGSPRVSSDRLRISVRADPFKAQLQAALREIAQNPDRPDNPVWGHLRIPSLPDDLRQTFGARRISVGDTQARLLLHIEQTATKNRRSGTATALSESELRSRFKMNGTELYYRLEQLRLLGFLVKTHVSERSEFTYDLSPAYRRELSP